MNQAMTVAEPIVRPHSAPEATSAPDAPLTVRSYGLTDPGRKRPGNEDCFLVARLIKALQIQHTNLSEPPAWQSHDQCHLFIVADGMGGHAGGEHASALAVHSVKSFVLDAFQWFSNCTGRDGDPILADFRRALEHANARVLTEANRHPAWHGMGTTMTLAFSLNGELFIAHVGDSRCYLFREGRLHRLTADHTLTEDLVRRGALAPEDAARHPWRHVITNAIGASRPEVTVEVHHLGMQASDRLLLCSDGLTTMLSDTDICQVLAAESDPEGACRRLLDRANEAGGKDNITVILAHYESINADA
jgi:protein phosphatase